ncbi:SERTA domain-containing protein 3 isoform X2 [Syngnathoides biaculeatus]|uniref:SERTA domain-containing protein 3 isoform X2 n=1 Tax=Syngnathoides biaculeatus TaxID=300417 RepID=UPI002ADDD997|nr:SERTA domain-containing protein 3 isoform X2 [Syngnathoides biaculeatus]
MCVLETQTSEFVCLSDKTGNVKMIMKTNKRKLQPESSSEESPGGGGGGGCCGALAWERQRQFVFSVSLHKFQRDQELPEPSLRRSVLISNTLRQVEACRAASPAPGGGGENDSPSPAKCQRVAPDEAEDWCSLSADPDFTISPAISSILTDLDAVPDDGAPAPTPRAALRSLENLRAVPDAGSSLPRPPVRGAHGLDPMEWEAGAETAQPGYLKNVTDDEDVFQDIDTSQLERDMGILGLRSDGRPPGDAKGLPSFSSFSSPPTPFRDGLDLEHLVTMLVET